VFPLFPAAEGKGGNVVSFGLSVFRIVKGRESVFSLHRRVTGNLGERWLAALGVVRQKLVHLLVMLMDVLKFRVREHGHGKRGRSVLL